jgi:uncharacterized membrane protein
VVSPFAMLLPAAVALLLSSWLCYQPTLKERWWFLPVVAAMSGANGLLWAVAARLSIDNRQTYSVSVAWDVLTMAAYNLLPLLACGVRLSPLSWVGFALVVLGACLVKWGG